MKKIVFSSLCILITFLNINRVESKKLNYYPEENEFIYEFATVIPPSFEFFINSITFIPEISSFASPPTNDNICSAETLIVDAPPIAGDVSTATLESNETSGSCWLSSANNTVWYSFVAPGSGLVEISTDFVTGLTNTQMTLYAVIDCSNFLLSTEVGCSENDGFTGSGNMAVISTALSPLIGGQTYHVQVDGFGTSVGGFEIQVKELPPLNDDCTSAKLLAANGNGSLINQFFGAATDSGGGTEICDNNSTVDPGDIWYEIQIIDSIDVIVVFVEPGINSDIVVAIYDSCTSIFPEACVDLGGNGGVENINFNIASDKYYLRIYEKVTSGEPLEIGVQGEILPIVLDRFHAKAEKKGNKITWTTSSEVNSELFEVQSSPNGSAKWEIIGNINMNGESSSDLNYELFDYNPYEVTYYRLNAVDKDGRTELSKVIKVQRSDVPGEITLSPNPAYAQISVQTTSSVAEFGIIRIIDMTGKVIMQENISLRKGLNTYTLDLDDLNPGLYLCSLKTEKGLIVEKLIKQ